MKALALAALALALPAGAIEVEKETYKVLGWSDACSVALERFAYPKLGEAFYGEPIATRVGVITIPPGETESGTLWHLEADGARSWSEAAVVKTEEDLKAAGWDRPGYKETLRPDAPADAPGVRDVLTSTATLGARLAWPGAEWRWSEAYFNPLTTCALLVFEKTEKRVRYLLKLARIDNPRARIDRARAHTAGALVLFDRGDVDGLLAESAIAAELAPEHAPARYHHARALALTGELDAAVSELKAAVTLDAKWGAKAKDERDFEPLRKRPDFRALLPR